MIQMNELQALQAMNLFLEQYLDRAGRDLLPLLGDTRLDEKNQTFDPAAWDDWMQCVRDVIDPSDPPRASKLWS